MLSQYGGYLKENSPVVITGRLSVRDDKEPQIVVNRARPISDYADGTVRDEPAPRKAPPKTGTLYLKISSEQDPLYRKIKAILNMFPGDCPVVLYFADTKARRGTRCILAESMLRELKNVLGEPNVVLK